MNWTDRSRLVLSVRDVRGLWLTACLIAVCLENIGHGQAPPRLGEIDPRGIPGELWLAGDDVEAPELLNLLVARRPPKTLWRIIVGDDGVPSLEGVPSIPAATEWRITDLSDWQPHAPVPDAPDTLVVWVHVDAAAQWSLTPEHPLRIVLKDVLDRGGCVVLSEAAARAAGEWCGTGAALDGTPDAAWQPGWGLLPGLAIASTGATDRPHAAAGLSGWAILHLGTQDVLSIHGRQLESIAAGATPSEIRLAECARRSATNYVVRSAQPFDLITLRRAAIVRHQAAPAFAESREVRVATGSLLIVGGGGFTDEMVKQFVAAAGGETARIVVIPSAEGDLPRLENRGDVRRFEEAGAARVTVLHATTRAEAGNEVFLTPLREATGVWFGGGRQWRFVDAYEGTPVVELCRVVLHRGGIIGGSSAGATIQGQYLVRGHPLGNTEMMAEGYEEGFGFLPGVAIDQHFTQRGRLPDLQAFHRAFPQLVGLGIDESTAILASGTEARVLGEGTVTILPARASLGAATPADADTDRDDDSLVVLRSGDHYDFRSGRIDRAERQSSPAETSEEAVRDSRRKP